MKFKLKRPALNPQDITKLSIIADYMGYLLKINQQQSSYMFVTEDKNVGYVQKDEYGRVFVVWKFEENIEYMKDVLNNIFNMKKMLNLPPKMKSLRNIFYPNITEICNKMK